MTLDIKIIITKFTRFIEITLPIMKDVIIIGAGIVGLATCYQLKEKQPDLNILLIEKEDDAARHQTGNNSGVIHSGIYYKPGSLKAVNCRKGYNLLLEFCDKHNVDYEICGKIIVAVKKEEVPYLKILKERGTANGLQNLKLLSAEEITELEPHARGVAGLFVPQTGIIDFKEVTRKLKTILLGSGVDMKFGEKVIRLNEMPHEVKITTHKNQYNTKAVICCAGLFSDKLALQTDPNLKLRIIPFRGEYFKLLPHRAGLVKNLIYPVPDPSFPFLGVHFTRMINGSVEAGPNAVFSFKREGYKKISFSLKDTYDSLTWPGFHKVIRKYWKTGFGEFYRSFNKRAFVKALQKLVPEITLDDLSKGGAGVRAQACDKNGGLIDDFRIVDNNRVVHVCNAPSPAATSSLSIGEFLSAKVLSKIK